MKVSDLRIGNLLHDEDGNTCIVRAIDGDRFETFKGQDYHGTANVYIDEYRGTIGKWLKKLNGVPLTIEWLERMGFTPDGVEGIYMSYSRDGVKIWHDVQKNSFLVDNIKTLKVEPKHVHGVQNAFFVLTGNELEVKP